MNIKKTFSVAITAMTIAFSINNAFALQESTPSDMTCQEFIDMNPNAMAPVAFWVVNRNSDLKGGHYVDWHSIENVSVPQMLALCHRRPHVTLGNITPLMK